MKRYYGSQQNVSKPVEKITLDAKTASKWRIFFIALFLCIGFGAFAYAFTHLHGSEKGWQKVVLDKVVEESCCYDFTLLYEFGKTGKSARKERNGLEAAYRKLTVRTYRVFDRRKEYSGLGNLCTVNRHPNEEVEVEPELYAALETCLTYNERMLFMGALTEHVEAWIASDSEEALLEYDPYLNEEVADFYQRTSKYANDPEAVSLRLLGNNEVMLCVSSEYEEFAKANDIVDYIDFGWARNAFVTDCLADSLQEQGYTHGILQSYDGFVRNFCEGDGSFRYSLSLWTDGKCYDAGEMEYTGGRSIVWLHDYPYNGAESEYRVLALLDGRKRHTYLGHDGFPKSAVPDMLIWSEKCSCGEISVRMAQYYIADFYDAKEAESEAKSAGIGFLICTNGELFCNDDSVTFPVLNSYDGLAFRMAR